MPTESSSLFRIVTATVVAGLAVASCTTGMQVSDNNNVGNLADVDSSYDPNRIVCKSYEPAGTQHAEKICMTAGQWKKKDGETK